MNRYIGDLFIWNTDNQFIAQLIMKNKLFYCDKHSKDLRWNAIWKDIFFDKVEIYNEYKWVKYEN